MRIEIDIKSKNEKFWKKRAWPRLRDLLMSRDLLFKFWDRANISGTAKFTSQKFCMQITCKGY